jgi:hypothetical protein
MFGATAPAERNRWHDDSLGDLPGPAGALAQIDGQTN